MNYVDLMIQKLANELLALKKQISSQGNTSYRDVPRRTYPNSASNYAMRNQNKLSPSLKRLVLEVPNSDSGYYEAKQTDLPPFGEEDANLHQEDDTPYKRDGDVFVVFTHSQAQVAQPPIIVKSDDPIQIKDSQHLPISIAKSGTLIPNPTKDNAISMDAVKDKSVSDSSTAINFSTPVNSSTPASKTSVPNILSSQNENSNQSFMNSFQSFDILDHAKKTKIQMSEVEFLRSNPDQFDYLVKFVKEKDVTPSNLPKSNLLQNN